MSVATPTRRKLKNINLMNDPTFNSKLVLTEFRRKFSRWLERGHPDMPYDVFEMRKSDFKPSAPGPVISPTALYPHDPAIHPSHHYWIHHPKDQANYTLFFDSYWLREPSLHGANQVDETRLVLLKSTYNIDDLVTWEGGLPQIDDEHIESEMRIENYWFDNHESSRVHKQIDIYLWLTDNLTTTTKRPDLLDKFYEYAVRHTDPTEEKSGISTAVLRKSRIPKVHSDGPRILGPSALPSNGTYGASMEARQKQQEPLH